MTRSIWAGCISLKSYLWLFVGLPFAPEFPVQFPETVLYQERSAGPVWVAGITVVHTEMLHSFLPLELWRMVEVLWWFHMLISEVLKLVWFKRKWLLWRAHVPDVGKCVKVQKEQVHLMVIRQNKNNRKGRCFHPNDMVGVQASPREQTHPTVLLPLKERKVKPTFVTIKLCFLLRWETSSLQQRRRLTSGQTQKLQGRLAFAGVAPSEWHLPQYLFNFLPLWTEGPTLVH